MTELVLYSVLILGLVIGLGLHARAQARARGDTLDAWCAGVGWRRETDRAVAKDVGRRIAGAGADVEHVVTGRTGDGREAVAVGSTTMTHSGGGDSTSTSRREDSHLAVRVRGNHPRLAVEPRPSFSWGARRDERRTGHPSFDARYLLLAADGAHAAVILPPPVLDRLVAEVAAVPWELRGEWLTVGCRGPLEPPRLEWLLAYAGALAPDLEAATGHAGAPAPGPR